MNSGVLLALPHTFGLYRELRDKSMGAGLVIDFCSSARHGETFSRWEGYMADARIHSLLGMPTLHKAVSRGFTERHNFLLFCGLHIVGRR